MFQTKCIQLNILTHKIKRDKILELDVALLLLKRSELYLFLNLW